MFDKPHIIDKHLENEVLDNDKFRIYKSDTIIDNLERVQNACAIIRENVMRDLGDKDTEEKRATTTWKHNQYNFFTYAMYVDPIFIGIWEDLVDVIKASSPSEAKYAWVQCWLNHDTHESVENNLVHHGHNCPIHGYIAINPQKTKTVFDEWEIPNEVGNIYCGLGKWLHHVENTGEYAGPRITIGYDVIYGDLPWPAAEDYDEKYQSLPWHEHWIPLVLK